MTQQTANIAAAAALSAGMIATAFVLVWIFS
jgi:hypothetical protein